MARDSVAAIDALGFVEVRGLAAAIETADCMLKSADVRLLRQLLRDPALTTITVEGSLGACSAAVDAGRAAALRMDGFVAATVMGRPANDTADFVLTLAEAGRAPFAPATARPAPAAKPAPVPVPAAAPAMAAAITRVAPPVATAAPAKVPPPTPDDEALLAALVGLPGGYSAQSLARRLGGTSAAVRERLEALCLSGQLVKRGNRYRLAPPSGDKK